jgi:DNA-binding transcriptional LysR family regulator
LVAEHLSFSRAAQVLGVRQSAVSRRVRALEDKLSVSLFERDSTGVRLTEAGRRFLERARPALAEIDHARKAAASAGRGAAGVIRIGILASVSGGFLRNLLGSYRGHHPAITMEIVEGSANISPGSRSDSSMSHSSRGRRWFRPGIASFCGRRGCS